MILGKVYIEESQMSLCCFTDSFRRRDTGQQGVVNFPYDDVSQADG